MIRKLSVRWWLLPWLPEAGEFGIGALAVLAALPVAGLINVINLQTPQGPEAVVLRVAILCAALMSLPVAAYFVLRRRAVQSLTVALLLLISLCVILIGVYFYRISFFVSFPADVLIWSESDFVNDIIKFRVGHPLYTVQQDNNSQVYTPGTQMLTYGLAWIFGRPASIQFYRLIQVIFSLLAAGLAFGAARRLEIMFLPEGVKPKGLIWPALLMPALYLFATNWLTNTYIHFLHNDGLAQLLTIAAYGLLLAYAHRHDRRILVVMALVPALGFLVKQSLAFWSVLYALYLAIFDRSRSLKLATGFLLTSVAAVVGVVAASYAIWGDPFIYWAFAVLAERPVSVLRGAQHILDAWPYFAMGLLGGVVLLRGRHARSLLGLWVVWLGLILQQAWSSGIAWTLSHMGSGSLVAGVWFLVALQQLWPTLGRTVGDGPLGVTWARTGASLALVALFFSSLGIVRPPLQPFSDAPSRYIERIEREFERLPASRVLLDMGSWVYFDAGVVMTDRAASIGDRGYTGKGDFSGMLRRLQEKHYAKILVRNLQTSEFWYDFGIWQTSTGIRQALLDNYREVGRIPAVPAEEQQGVPFYAFAEISILVPK